MRSARADRASAVPNDLEAYWIPFTPNRAFKASPRLIARAKDMHYYTPEGRSLLDGTAGLWCTNAGHSREPIVAAIRSQASELDYAPAFQFSHPKAFELASRVAALAPGDLDHVFFCNSGSEAVDTALKIALAYHNVRGEGASHAADRARARLSWRRISAASRWAASSTTASSSARCLPASIICRPPTAASTKPSAKASRIGAPILRMISSASLRCTTLRPSRP